MYACRPSDIIDVLMGQFGDEADSINLSFDIETCSGKTENCTTLLPDFILLTGSIPALSMCIQQDWGSSLVECFTGDRWVADSRLIDVTALRL